MALGVLGGRCWGDGIICSKPRAALVRVCLLCCSWHRECCLHFKAVQQKSLEGEPEWASAVNWASAAVAEGQELLHSVHRARLHTSMGTAS